MENQIAIVTGGCGGIGTAISQSLCQQGAKVIATYYRNGNHAAAKAWQQQQKNLGFDIEIAYTNVSDYESTCSLVRQVEERLGQIDILINNAGITADSQFSKMSKEQWDQVLTTNLDSLFNVTRPAIDGMIARGYGRIINISSINAQKGQFGQTNYAASKAGIHGFTKSLALEVARKGITVNTISPGYIETDMVMAVAADIREQLIKQIPVQRLGQPDEIARAVVFLASKQSGFITGANLAINGGHHMF